MNPVMPDHLPLGCRANLAKGTSMRALLLAVAIGAILAVGAGFGAGSILSGVANGKPVNAQLYNYGQR
jgi:hypothetical protein